jgi:hypothetical protein
MMKERFVAKVHNTSAVIGVSGAILGLGFTFNLWYLVAGTIISMGVSALTSKNKVWWVEICAFLGVGLGLVMHYFGLI